jgi:monovalent cation:H+ antiporter-2, CPA2 family
MSQESPLVAILAIGLGLAFLFGTLANRLKLSPLVGYLLAGVVIGPFTPGYVADQHLALQLAEIGVILLMFGVGLHFSPKDLLAVRGLVVPGAILQMAVAVALGIGVAHLLGWPVAAGLVFGLSLSVASTVVMIRALQDRRLMETDRGRAAVGWLVVQDLLTVLTLVLLPPLASLLKGGEGLDLADTAGTLALTLGKLALFVALMLVIGKRVVPAILHYIAHTGSRELFRLAVLSLALCVAFAAAELFGVSIALGAFFAGMILSESPLSQRAAEESLPLRDAFAVLFFVSVGMLFDPLVLMREPVALALTLGVVLLSAAAAFVLVRLFGYPLATALLLGAGLAQIGEFSFILADLGIGFGLMPARARDLILGVSIISIFVNPFLLQAASILRRRYAPEETGSAATAHGLALPAPSPTALTGHVVLVGYGRVGTLVAEGLNAASIPVLIVEAADDASERLKASGFEFLQGNAAQDGMLGAANLPAARMLVVAIPEAFEANQIVKGARKLAPLLPIVARAHFDAQVENLLQHGANAVVMGERELAHALLTHAGVAA